MTKPPTRRRLRLQLAAGAAAGAGVPALAWLAFGPGSVGFVLTLGGVPAAVAARVIAGAVLLGDLHRGRAALDRGRHAAGEAATRRFLAALARRPWLERRHPVVAHAGRHTGSLETMARNSLGAALIGQGRLEEAREELRRALARDPA